MADRILTRARIKDLLIYDVEHGVFRWKINDHMLTHLGKHRYHITIDGIEYKVPALAWFYEVGTWPEENTAKWGLPGVYECGKHWTTEIRIGGKRHGLGTFKSPVDAYRARLYQQQQNTPPLKKLPRWITDVDKKREHLAPR